MNDVHIIRHKIAFESVEEILKTDGAAKLLADNMEGSLVVTGVPAPWREEFLSHGFTEYARYRDYWIDAPAPLEPKCGDYEFLRPEDCAAASELTTACSGQSRGFGTENAE